MRRACTSRLASQVPRKRTRRGRVRVGQRARRGGRAARRRPRSGTAQLEAREDGGELGRGEAGEGGDILDRGGPEAAEVAADEVILRVLAGDVRGREPVGGQAVEVRAAALPRPRRRDAHEVEPEPRRARPVFPSSESVSFRRTLCCRRSAPRRHSAAAAVAAGPSSRAWRAATPRGAPRGRRSRRPIVGGGDEVDGAAHQRRLDHLARLERARERVALEAGDPRPQPEVHRRRVLRLQPAHPLEHARGRQAGALQQPLAGEQRSIERAGGEDALSHA